MSKDQILEAALQLFGERGFDAVGTREIAAVAGTAMSAIAYHFGSKEGLYLALADHVAAEIAGRMASINMDARQALGGSRADAVEAAANIVEGFAQIMLDPTTHSRTKFVIREMQQPTKAIERVYERFMRDQIALLVSLVGQALPHLSRIEAGATAALLHGQAVVLRVGGVMIGRVLDVDAIDEKVRSTILNRIRSQTMLILSEERPE